MESGSCSGSRNKHNTQKGQGVASTLASMLPRINPFVSRVKGHDGVFGFREGNLRDENSERRRNREMKTGIEGRTMRG